MLRLLPLLAFALLPAAVAAPVPPGGRTEFGTNGLLTHADLEKVKFDSRLVKDGDKFREEKAEKEVEDVVKRRIDGPVKVRPANRYDVATHMSWTKFREGEPMPAYFVLRNNRGSVLGLRSRIDMCEPTPTLRGGSCQYDIRDRATGKSVIQLRSSSTHCGGGSLVDVPADGFYCVSGDLNRLAGRVLPPGDYEVDWRYGNLCSAPVAFTVREHAGAKSAKLPNRPALHFYHIDPEFGEAEEERPDTVGEPFRWRDCELAHVDTDDFAAALAVGQHGTFVPDLHTVGKADKLVEAWVEWKPYRDGDRVVVTLRAVLPYERVCFEEVPRLHLQIETPADAERGRQSADRKLKALERDTALVTPLTIEARLPTDWREHVGASGAARVSVLVTANRIELPRWGDRMQKLQEEKSVRRSPDAPPLWSGVVRSDATELRFPPRMPAPTPAP